ncbi:MAG: hypothetical protein Q4G63_11505 [Bacteroidia bacterium]|nr:hypothetical protein [Bacteroidia bacterium]
MKDFLLYIRFAVDYAIQNNTLSHVKYLRRWHKDKKSSETTLSRQLPWMTYDAIDFLSGICLPEMKIFEWGSGGSTLFFASRCQHVTTIEHDSIWSGFLKEKLDELNIQNVDFKKISGEKIDNFEQKNYQNPDDFVSKDKKSVGLSYEKYVKAIEAFPKEYFDIIVVDGRARNSCIKLAIPHIKKGGYLIVDNSDRQYYLVGFPELNDPQKWQKTEFQGPVFFQHAFSKTSFFRKEN